MLIAAVLALVALSQRGLGQRDVKLQNDCSYPVWAAVVPFSDNAEAYGGDRSIELKAGGSKVVQVPSSWSGRMWARHGCVSSGNKLACVTGGCSNGLAACDDGDLAGAATAVEMRLQFVENGQYDVYDLSNGGGWGVPTGIKPVAKSCEEINCTPALKQCPEELQVLDSYGAILGCKSACYAQIGDSDVQCCAGKYADPRVCTPDLITHYSYFKDSCPNAYAAFQDSRAGDPTVNFMCPSAGDSGFFVTFCPEGDGDSAGTGEGQSQPTGLAETTGQDDEAGPTVTNDVGDALPTGEPTSSKPASKSLGDALPSNLTVASSSATSSGAGAGSAASTSKSATSSGLSAPLPSSSSNADGSSMEETTEDGETTSLIPGVSNVVLGIIVAVVAVILIGGAIAAIVISHRKNKATDRQRQQQQQAAAAGTTRGPADSDDSDVEKGRSSGAGGSSGSNQNPAQGYNSLAHGRRRSRHALLSSSESELSDESEEEPYVRRRSSRGSRR
ncbi:thaumatin family protein [Rhodotorula paludigena]|uniref:thaumatin family protein n=1 Tax=Rhodotorula paludigena TaxID=86838 RepID=UPI00316B961A